MRQMPPNSPSAENPKFLLRMDLSEERKQGLEKKLREYEERLERDTVATDRLDSEYKTAILTALLSGHVEQQLVWEEIKQKDGKVLGDIFDNAWGVIYSYNNGNLRRVAGGTPFENK